MTTLTINDLPVCEELDRKAMAAVEGGKTYVEAAQELAQFARDFLAGKCELSSTGKSWVCY